MHEEVGRQRFGIVRVRDELVVVLALLGNQRRRWGRALTGSGGEKEGHRSFPGAMHTGLGLSLVCQWRPRRGDLPDG